jgi:L,D-peptidoglycan transpeptidase YkuD (ErfK/YbiS/YcfS/YnhG family)
MTIKIKNKYTLLFDEFEFKCSIGAFGFTSDKYEGDKKTPTGLFSLGDLYYRSDKVQKPKTKLKCIKIKKNMGWCNDIDSKLYNKKIKIKKKVRYEKLFRNDYKYNYLIPIKYNWVNPKKNKGSAIFIHLTKNYNPTAGCIALSLKDFLILVKLIKKNTKIRII